MPSRLLRNIQPSALILLLPVAVSAAPGEVSRESIHSQGAEHTYFVFVPKAIAGHAGAPLVMLLHGSGHDGRSLLDPWKKLASQEGLVLVAPNSLNPEFWRNKLEGPAPLIAIAEAVRAKYETDPRRVYLFGHSAGAMFALLMAVWEPDYFAAVAVHAGVMPPAGEPFLSRAKRKTPIQLQVGTRDGSFPVSDVRQTRDLLVDNDFPVELKEIANHDHNYYAIADRVNRDAWDFMKDKTRGE